MPESAVRRGQQNSLLVDEGQQGPETLVDARQPSAPPMTLQTQHYGDLDTGFRQQEAVYEAKEANTTFDMDNLDNFESAVRRGQQNSLLVDEGQQGPETLVDARQPSAPPMTLQTQHYGDLDTGFRQQEAVYEAKEANTTFDMDNLDNFETKQKEKISKKRLGKRISIGIIVGLATVATYLTFLSVTFSFFDFQNYHIRLENHRKMLRNE
uniref:Uncharacterized protein n=1 Tax=Panagrolaimus sp. JU765 TaxID=591449 RepID=A0AC34QAQ6_9BILA